MTGLDTQALKTPSIVHASHHEQLSAQAYDYKTNFAGKSSRSIHIGRISNMNEPSGWQSGQPNLRLGYIEYHPGNDEVTKLYTFDRGRRLTDDDAKSFADVLYKEPPHPLKAEELASLQQHGVLRDKGSDFVPLLAKTEDVNGRRVLVVEGSFKGENLHVRTTYIDADVNRDGSVIQELTYQAPEQLFHQYLPEVRKSLQSIVWK